MNEENLIFLISQPRSGSTMLQKLIMTSGEVNSLSEPWWLLQVLGHDVNGLIQAGYNEALASEGKNDFSNAIGHQAFLNARRKYILELYGLARKDLPYFLDKTPRYYEILDQIQETLPNSKKLILVRHPLDVLSSIINTWVSKGAYLGNYYRDLCLAPFILMNYLKCYHPNSVLVKYEEISSNPKSLSALMYDVGLKFSFKNVLNDSSEWIMGDKGENSENKTVISGNRDNWKELMDNSKWSAFIQGYADYLGKEFFDFYGYEYPSAAKPTRAFNKFLKEGKEDLHLVDLSDKLKKKLRARFDL